MTGNITESTNLVGIILKVMFICGFIDRPVLILNLILIYAKRSRLKQTNSILIL